MRHIRRRDAVISHRAKWQSKVEDDSVNAAELSDTLPAGRDRLRNAMHRRDSPSPAGKVILATAHMRPHAAFSGSLNVDLLCVHSVCICSTDDLRSAWALRPEMHATTQMCFVCALRPRYGHPGNAWAALSRELTHCLSRAYPLLTQAYPLSGASPYSNGCTPAGCCVPFLPPCAWAAHSQVELPRDRAAKGQHRCLFTHCHRPLQRGTDRPPSPGPLPGASPCPSATGHPLLKWSRRDGPILVLRNSSCSLNIICTRRRAQNVTQKPRLVLTWELFQDGQRTA